MNEKIYLMEMQHRTDEHETDRLIAYLKKTAETEIKEGRKIMMKYEIFKDVVENAVLDYLPPEFQNSELHLQRVKK